jgi:hypothetical protein
MQNEVIIVTGWSILTEEGWRISLFLGDARKIENMSAKDTAAQLAEYRVKYSRNDLMYAGIFKHVAEAIVAFGEE